MDHDSDDILDFGSLTAKKIEMRLCRILPDVWRREIVSLTTRIQLEHSIPRSQIERMLMTTIMMTTTATLPVY